MAGELGSIPYGMPITIGFTLANPGAGAATALTTAQGGAGYMVPAGYVFHPMLLSACGTAAVTAGTATLAVTDNTVAVANAPTALLSSVAGSTLANAGMARLGAAPIAAGHVVGVTVTTNGAYLPTTNDVDVLLAGVLVGV